MNVRLQVSGGFAGLKRVGEASAEALPAPLAALVHELVNTPPPSSRANPAARDMLQSRLDISSADDGVALSFDASNLADRFEPLLDHLNALSRPAPPA